MKRGKSLGFLLSVVGLCAIGIGALFAQEVQHHDFLVNMNDPKTCLTCHDGTIAPNIGACTKVSCLFDKASSHPVFKKYPPAGKEDLFFPAARVEAAGLRLINGEVSCVSCHNLLNRDQYHLIIENYRSRLCMTCHIR